MDRHIRESESIFTQYYRNGGTGSDSVFPVASKQDRPQNLTPHLAQLAYCHSVIDRMHVPLTH